MSPDEATVTTTGVSLKMNIIVPFTSEADQTTFQTTIATSMKTIDVTNYYKTSTGSALISQGTFAMTAPEVTGGASAMTVLGAVSMAVLAAAF